jgi:hypothetical protein
VCPDGRGLALVPVECLSLSRAAREGEHDDSSGDDLLHHELICQRTTPPL